MIRCLLALFAYASHASGQASRLPSLDSQVTDPAGKAIRERLRLVIADGNEYDRLAVDKERTYTFVELPRF